MHNYRVTVYYRNAQGHPHMWECTMNHVSGAQAEATAVGIIQGHGGVIRMSRATQRW